MLKPAPTTRPESTMEKIATGSGLWPLAPTFVTFAISVTSNVEVGSLVLLFAFSILGIYTYLRSPRIVALDDGQATFMMPFWSEQLVFTDQITVDTFERNLGFAWILKVHSDEWLIGREYYLFPAVFGGNSTRIEVKKFIATIRQIQNSQRTA